MGLEVLMMEGFRVLWFRVSGVFVGRALCRFYNQGQFRVPGSSLGLSSCLVLSVLALGIMVFRVLGLGSGLPLAVQLAALKS